MSLDDLELELRKLPGVRAAGFTESDDVLLVQVHVGHEVTEPNLALQATRIAFRHSERPVAVELVRWRVLERPPSDDAVTDTRAGIVVPPVPEALGAPEEKRVRLLAVLTFPDTDELEVHLTLDSGRTIGRAAASRGLLGAVEATLDALRTFVPELPYSASWARTLDTAPGQPFLAACALSGLQQSSRHGLAAGSSAIEAAARATLQALNRSLARELTPAT